MIKYIVYLNRAECSKPDMKCYFRDLHAHLFYLFKQFLGKMQSCCRSCRRTIILCINGLVTILILQLMCNIWWKRHLSELVQNFFEDSLIMELDQTITILYNINNLSSQNSIAKYDLGSRLCLLARLNKRLPDIVFLSL